MLRRSFTTTLPAVFITSVLLGCNAHPVAAPSAAATAPTVAADTSAPRLTIAPVPLVRPAAVVLDGIVREAVPNDYLRVLFIPPNKSGDPTPVVTQIGLPWNLRAFATATPLYQPPLTVEELPLFSGLVDNESQYMVALRCRPPQPTKVDAILATWPNVFAALPVDTKLDPAACTANPTDPGIQTACYAAAFKPLDTASAAVPPALARVFDYAAVLFDTNHAAQAKWLKGAYGIYPAFAGTGYSVKGSYYLDGNHPMTTASMLSSSISPEYLLKNVSLADAGCSCITVPPYTGRNKARLDPNFIDQAGGAGSCNVVQKLP